MLQIVGITGVGCIPQAEQEQKKTGTKHLLRVQTLGEGVNDGGLSCT